MSLPPARPVRVIAGAHSDDLPFDDLFEACEPVLLKNALKSWPLLDAARAGDDALVEYLKRFASERPITTFVAGAETRGRFHYAAGGDGFNFVTNRVALSQFLDSLLEQKNEMGGAHVYAGSTDIDTFLPGLRDANDLPLAHHDFAHKAPLASMWIGNRTTACAHFDASNNIACVIAGRRRFTLFPPDQVANLYPGPLEPTPAGQVVTMVDLAAPDLHRYPRFAQAMENAQVAEMEPGDILYYPALWWHQVDALDPMNVMVNYWWNAVPAHADTPETTLLHALLSLRDRPAHEKAAWRELFDFYVFGDAAVPAAHLPEAMQGALAPLDDMRARRLRAQILNRINR